VAVSAYDRPIDHHHLTTRPLLQIHIDAIAAFRCRHGYRLTAAIAATPPRLIRHAILISPSHLSSPFDIYSQRGYLITYFRHDISYAIILPLRHCRHWPLPFYCRHFHADFDCRADDADIISAFLPLMPMPLPIALLMLMPPRRLPAY